MTLRLVAPLAGFRHRRERLTRRLQGLREVYRNIVAARQIRTHGQFIGCLIDLRVPKYLPYPFLCLNCAERENPRKDYSVAGPARG